MLFVVQAGREEALMERFRRWGLQAAVVGQVLAEPVVRVLQHGSVAAEVPSRALAEDTPINQHTSCRNHPLTFSGIGAGWRRIFPPVSAITTGGRICCALLDDPTIASKRWVLSPIRPAGAREHRRARCGADAAVVRLRPQQG